MFSVLSFTSLSQEFEISEYKTMELLKVRNAANASADIDLNGYPDLIIQGYGPSFFGGDERVSVYLNDENGFTEVANTGLIRRDGGDLKFAFLNDDAYPDLIQTGEDDNNSEKTSIYLNDGDGTFTKTSQNLRGVRRGELAIGDINGDNFIDFIVTGDEVTKVFIGDGTGQFSQHNNTGDAIPGLDWSVVDLVDVNGDDVLDVVIGGDEDSVDPFLKVYTNDGSGNFTETESIPSIWKGDMEVGLFNNDDHIDIILIGANGSNSPSKFYYTGNGDGTFTAASFDVNFTLHKDCSIRAKDINSDGDLDLVYSGARWNNSYEGYVLLNDGTGAFTVANNSSLPGSEYSDMSIVDLDLDGFYEVIISGEERVDGSDNYFTRVYSYEQVCSGLSDSSIVQNGNAYSFNEEGLNVYQWTTCTDASTVLSTENSFEPEASGDYQLTVTKEGCGYELDCISIVVAGLNQYEKNSLFYPNPTEGKISLDSKYSSIKILSGNGELVDEILTETSVVDLSEYESGIYFLNLGDRVVKVLKQ